MYIKSEIKLVVCDFEKKGNKSIGLIQPDFTKRSS